jgi:PEP-CTERM motif
MGSKQLRWLLVIAVLAFAGTAKADTVSVNGTYAFASNGYGIPPYGGTLNGQNASFYCVDFTHDITGGMSWNVIQTSLTGTSFSSTLLGDQTTYQEMAWLITQMMGTSDQTLQAEYQYAIWWLSDTSAPDPFGTDSALVADALAAVNGEFTGQGFVILTPTTGSYGQEFMIKTPEPSVLLLLGIGLMALVLLAYKKHGTLSART